MNALVHHLSGIFLILLTSHFSGSEKTLQNQPPKVVISTPQPGTTIIPGTSIPYSIEVTDAEDGDSQYGEITTGEVFLEVYFYPAGIDHEVNEILDPLPPNGLTLMKKKQCFTCHNSKTALVGPSLNNIALKYHEKDLEKLADRVLQGSAGSWGDAAMPPQTHLTKAEAQLIIQWILSYGNDENHIIYGGIEGSFIAYKSQGNYRLVASYTDHGSGGIPGSGRTGIDQILLQTP